MPSKIDTPCPAYTKMISCWPLINALWGGTTAMRLGTTEWLPKESGESEIKYAIRLNRSILFNGYKNAVKGLVSKPFSKAVALSENAPARLQPIEKDANREGLRLTAWSRLVYEDALKYGLSHVLVEYPVVPEADKLSRVDEEQSDLRPYFVHVSARDLFFWSSSRNASGVRELDEVRFYQDVERPDGDYGVVCVKQIRQYTRTTWAVWEKDKDTGDWKTISEGTHTFGKVPLATYYTNWTGFMTAEPPLEDLAWLNLAHWQSYSDQRNILRVMRVAILFAKGFSDDDASKQEGKIVIGPNLVVEASNTEAELGYVEHSGKGIEAGAEDIKDIEERMVQLGLRPFIERTQVRTATSANINDSNASSDSQAWNETFEQFLRLLYEMGAQWIKVPLPDDFAASLNRDYVLAARALEDNTLLLEMRKAREITRKTYLSETQRRGLLDESLDLEQEIEDLKNEEPPMDQLGGAGGFGQPNDPADPNEPNEPKEPPFPSET